MQDKPIKMLNRDYLLILLLTFLYGFNMNLINPIIAKYATTLGASETVMGIAVGLFSITALIARPLTGPLANNRDKKQMLILSFMIYIVASIGYMLFDSIQALLIFRFMHGLGLSLCSALLPTLTCEYVPENRIGAAIGYFTLAQTIAMAIAPNIGIAITERFGYSANFMIAGAVSLISVILAFALKKQSFEIKRLSFSFSDIVAKGAILPAVLHTLGAMAYSLVSSFIVVYGTQVRGISPERIGLCFTVYALTLIVTRPFLAATENRINELYIIIFCAALSMFGMILIGVASSLWMFILAMVLMAFGFGVLMPVLQALAIKLVNPDSRAIANSTFNAGMDIGMGVGPILGGFAVVYIGYSNTYLFFAVFEATVIILSIISRHKLRYEAGKTN